MKSTNQQKPNGPSKSNVYVCVCCVSCVEVVCAANKCNLSAIASEVATRIRRGTVTDGRSEKRGQIAHVSHVTAVGIT